MDSQQAIPNGAADRTVHLAGLLIHRSDTQSIDCIRWGPGDPKAGYREERADTGRDPSTLTPLSDISATCESCLSPPACSSDELLSCPSWKAGVSRFFFGSKWYFRRSSQNQTLMTLLGCLVWSSDSDVGFFKAGSYVALASPSPTHTRYRRVLQSVPWVSGQTARTSNCLDFHFTIK